MVTFLCLHSPDSAVAPAQVPTPARNLLVVVESMLDWVEHALIATAVGQDLPVTPVGTDVVVN